MSKITAFIRTLTGKNKTGQIVYGVLDVMPIPPIHNLIRMAVKEDVPKSQIPAYVWQKIDKLRLTTSAIAIALAGAVAKGVITLEDAIEFLKVLSSLL
jgi:hypothetical protein